MTSNSFSDNHHCFWYHLKGSDMVLVSLPLNSADDPTPLPSALPFELPALGATTKY